MKPLYVYFGRRLFLLALLSAISFCVYVEFLGRGTLARILLASALIFWGATILCGLIGPLLLYKKAAEQTYPASPLMWLGIALCLLPTPWTLGIVKVTGNPKLIASPIVLIPAGSFLIIGGALIAYRIVITAIRFLR